MTIPDAYPPTVIYSFLKSGRDFGLGFGLDRTTFVASVLMARHHFNNVSLVCDPVWKEYLNHYKLLHLFDRVIDVKLPKELSASTMDVFWSSKCKSEALNWALEQNDGRSILLMDADVILWDSHRIRWAEEKLKFVGGYVEPLSWEAYQEQPARLGGLFNDVFKSLNLGQQKCGFEANPVNGGFLYFNDRHLVRMYVNFIELFIKGFVEGGFQPRPFFKEFGSPKSGVDYFSEVMMVDQRALGELLQAMYGRAYWDGAAVDFITRFAVGEEYPQATHEFIHLWKLKGVAKKCPEIAVLVEQSILEKLHSLLGDTTLLEDYGFVLTQKRVPLVLYENQAVIRYTLHQIN